MLENMLKTLIIDADQRAVGRLVHELASQGFMSLVCRVETLDELQASMEGGRPDIVLSEVNIGGVNGFLALEMVRAFFPDVPFIFVCQTYSPSLIVEVFENGANGYVLKHQLSDLRDVVLQAQSSRIETSDAEESSSPWTSMPDEANHTVESELSADSIIKPICPRCKRIEDLDGDWQPVEIHLRLHHRATVALGTCPDCADALMRI